MIAEGVTVTEGHGPGELSQECSRHHQDRLGWSGQKVRGRTASLLFLEALQVDKTQPHSRRKQEVGDEPNGNIHGPELLLQWLGMGLSTQHQEPRAGPFRPLSSGPHQVDCRQLPAGAQVWK